MAYASLLNHLEDNEVISEKRESISITHFKRRIQAVLGSYLPLDCAAEKGRVYSSVPEMFALQSKTLPEMWTELNCLPGREIFL